MLPLRIRDEQLPFSLMLLAVSLAYPKVVEKLMEEDRLILASNSRRGKKNI
jgi:hypothetical protein